MRAFILWATIWLNFAIFGLAMDQQIAAETVGQDLSWMSQIDDGKLRSSGSIVLVKDGLVIKILLGVRNKPGRNEDKTLSSFHGNIIRRGGIDDKDALDACKRNLLWELLLIEGDHKRADLDEDAKSFLGSLKVLGMLKNRSWETDQRPNFVFMIDREKAAQLIGAYEGKVLIKSKTSKWPPEFNALHLVDARALLEAIERQIALDSDPENLIKYGKFTECENKTIYDAFTRTIAVSKDQFLKILEQCELDRE